MIENLLRKAEFAVGRSLRGLTTLRDRADRRIFRVGLLVGIVTLSGCVRAAKGRAQVIEPLRIEARTEPGTCVVGQAFELRVSVIAGKPPQIDPPRIDGAQVWKIGTKARSIKAGIGSVVAEESQFVVSFRVVAQRSGKFEIPRILARVGNRSGQSEPIRLTIGPVPSSGRTADFLGGVGHFSVAALASPSVVRVGQELDYRIRVSGPAAWGMNGRPVLSRFQRLGLGLRIESRPDELTEEPPERTIVYRLRPTKAGDAVLPPVAIAAYEPSLSQYVTRVTSSVPIRVVAVPAFDPASIDGDRPKSKSARSAWAALLLWGLVLAGTSAALVWVRRRTRRRRALGPVAARRYAARLARRYAADPGSRRGGGASARIASNQDAGSGTDDDAAQRVHGELMHYLEIGIGRPTGALTPAEAWQGVRDLTGSHDLAGQAGRLADRCDWALYGDLTGAERAREIRERARVLFEALGRVRRSRAD
jgi:hypothetical protein